MRNKLEYYIMKITIAVLFDYLVIASYGYNDLADVYNYFALFATLVLLVIGPVAIFSTPKEDKNESA